jgi:hypothetical protein
LGFQWSASDPFAAALGLSASLICFQGGIVYDYQARLDVITVSS